MTKNKPSEPFRVLTRTEVEVLKRSQIATGSQKHRDPRFPPYAFTEHGAIILNSRRTIEMSIYLARAFSSAGFARTTKLLSASSKPSANSMHTPELKKRPSGFAANLDG